MPLIEVLRSKWKWLLPLVLVAPASLFSPMLIQAYYRSVELPRLSAPSSSVVIEKSCAEHKSSLPERAPKVCDLVRTKSVTTGGVIETFYFGDASRFTLESRQGQWHSSTAECIVAERQFWLSAASMILFLALAIAKSVRTGQFFYFPGVKRHALNDFEMVLGMYAVTLFAGSLIGIGSVQCVALGIAP